MEKCGRTRGGQGPTRKFFAVRVRRSEVQSRRPRPPAFPRPAKLGSFVSLLALIGCSDIASVAWLDLAY